MRVLLVTPVLPWPIEPFGAAQRTYLLGQALQRAAAVEFLHVGPPAEAARDPAQLASLGIAASFPAAEPRRAGLAGYLAGLPGPFGNWADLVAQQHGLFAPVASAAAWLAGRLSERRYDAIVCRYLRTAARLGLTRMREVPLLVDVDDLDSSKFEAQTATAPWRGLGGRIGMRLVRSALRANERRMAEACDHLWLAHADDGRHVLARGASALPNVPFFPSERLPDYRPAPAAGPTLLFVGLLDYTPNLDGLEWFLARVWPTLREKCPTARLRIVGPRLAESVSRRWAGLPGVEPLGFVESLDAVYESCAFCIAPVRWGGGTNIKVLEACARGRACVASPHAVRGFPVLTDGQSVIAANTADAFATACRVLLNDPNEREARARRGYEQVREHYSPASFAARVLSDLADVTAAARQRPAQPLARRAGGNRRDPQSRPVAIRRSEAR